MIILN